jgi:ABC-2 type transport system permease protein
MLKHLVLFELKYYRKQAVFWVAVAYSLFAGSLLLSNTSESLYYANSPFSVIDALLKFNAMSTIFVTGFLAASSILRDRTNNFESIIFSTPILKFEYLSTKFIGLLSSTLFIHLVLTLTMMLSVYTIKPELVGPFNIGDYLFGLTVILIPNILLCVSIIFSTAMLTKKMMPIYIVTIALFVVYVAASMIGNSPLMAMSTPFTQEGGGIASLIDPYGIISFYEQSSFWSVEDKNVMLPLLEGNFLYNRLSWLIISISILGLTYKRFSFKGKNSTSKSKIITDDTVISLATYKPVSVENIFDKFYVKVFYSKLKIEYLSVVKGLSFFVIMCLIVVLNMITLGENISRGPADQVSYYPLTELILQLLQDPLSKIGILISIFYAIELYWNERSNKIYAIIDSTPVKNSLFYLSKLSALALISFTVIFISCLAAILFQFSMGHYDVKPLLYLRLFYYSGTLLILVGGFTFFLQRFAPNKATSLALGALIFVYPKLLAFLDLAHPLNIFAYNPTFIFSDMANVVYHEEAYHWVNLYWSAFVGLLSIFTIKYWKRGYSNKPIILSIQMKIAGLAFALIFLGSGVYNYYQYNIMNVSETKAERIRYKAYYEKTYSKYEDLAQPSITHINVDVDIYPHERRYVARGDYIFKNKTSQPIEKLMISVQKVSHLVYDLNIKDAEMESKNENDQVLWYKLNVPLQPGDSSTLDYTIDITRTAFSRLDGENYVTSGGSYFELEDYLPFFGYLGTYELNNRTNRIEQGLPETSILDPAEAEPLYTDDWLFFSAKISTIEDQTAVTVGTLEKEELIGGRRYFYYKTDQKIKRIFPIMSAEYSVATASHNGIELKIFHAPHHSNDNENLFAAVKGGLDYFQENFAPYTFKEFKIVELPYFSSEQSFGAAFPGMYGGVENRFFNLNIDDEPRNPSLSGAIHEFSHQYWGGYITPNYVGGSSMLTEVLAKYSELVLEEKLFGKYSNNEDLNQAIGIYLRNRTRSDNPEKPLSTIGFEPLNYYFKGLHSMTALRDLIGEEKINQALRNLLAKYRHPQRPTSHDLLNEYYLVSDTSQHTIIADLFTRIVFHDFKLDSAHVIEIDNTFTTELNVTALKFVVDEVSNTEFTETINDSIEIAYYSGFPDIENENMTYLTKVKLSNEHTSLSITSDHKPRYITIDPNRYRIDRSLEDNLIEIE